MKISQLILLYALVSYCFTEDDECSSLYVSKLNETCISTITAENANQNIINNQLTDNHNLDKFWEQENKSEREELHHSTEIDSKKNELKINLFSEKIPQGKLEKLSVKYIINNETLGHSLDENQSLAFLGSNVPFLNVYIQLILIIIRLE